MVQETETAIGLRVLLRMKHLANRGRGLKMAGILFRLHGARTCGDSFDGFVSYRKFQFGGEVWRKAGFIIGGKVDVLNIVFVKRKT